MRYTGTKFLSAMVILLLMPINMVYPLAPPSQTDRLLAALQAALSKPSVVPKTSSLSEILNAALDNIFLPPSMQEDRAKKIFGNNPERMDDLIERLRDHGASKLHLEREKLDEIIHLVERMRTPGAVAKKEMHRLTGIRDREVLLLALDHALDPDPYHPVRPRKYYHARQDRLIPIPWIHGRARESLYEESAELVSETLEAAGQHKVWVHVEYTSRALSEYLVPTMMPLWEEILRLLMAEKDPRERMFTPNTLSKISKNAKLEDFLKSMVREMQEAGVRKTFTREEMEATIAEQELSRDKKLKTKKFPQILDILKHFSKIPQVEGVVLETEGQDRTTILNGFLSEFLFRARHARYLRRYFASSLDYLRWQRYIDHIATVLRDDHMLDLTAKILDRNPEASAAIIRGSAHAWTGPWFKSYFPFAKLFKGNNVTDYVLASELESLRHGVVARDEQEDKRILVDDMVSRFAELTSSFFEFSDILGKLPEVRKRISDSPLSELIWIHDSSAAQGLVVSSAMVQALQERGLLSGFSDSALWDLPKYRCAQFGEILSRTIRDSGYQSILMNKELSGLLLVPSIAFLTKAMTRREKDLFMKYAMRVEGFPTQPKELVDKILSDPMGEISWETVKREAEKLEKKDPLQHKWIPRIREWFEMMRQDLEKPINLPAHPEDEGNTGSSPQEKATAASA